MMMVIFPDHFNPEFYVLILGKTERVDRVNKNPRPILHGIIFGRLKMVVIFGKLKMVGSKRSRPNGGR
jgi:hypothetical protein